MDYYDAGLRMRAREGCDIGELWMKYARIE
jgi:hypothetical protein